MWKRWTSFAVVLVILSLNAGCFGGSKASGKFSNQDKPKPVEGQK